MSSVNNFYRFRRKMPSNADGWAIIDIKTIANPGARFAGYVYGFIFLIIFISFILFLGASYTFIIAKMDASSDAIANASEHRQRLTTTFTILGGLIGAPLLIWRLATAQHQANTAREAYFASLIGSAIEKLSAMREVEVIVYKDDGQDTTWKRYEPFEDQQRGAIEILSRVAKDSDRDAWPIAGILAAFLRREIGRTSLLESRARMSNLEDDEVKFQSAKRLILSSLRRLTEIVASARYATDRLDIGDINLSYFEIKSIDFHKLSLAGARFAKAKFKNCSISDCDLSGSMLEGTEWTFEETSEFWIWDNVKFSEATFENAKLCSATATNCLFVAANFSGADLRGTRFVDCDFKNAFFDYARLHGCDLRYAYNLNESHLAAAYGDATTLLPATVQKPRAWVEAEHGSGAEPSSISGSSDMEIE